MGLGQADLTSAPNAVLVVDDDPSSLHAVSRVLRAAGHQVLQSASASAARSMLERAAVSVVLLDIGLPDLSGLELLRELRLTHPDASVVMLTGSPEKADMEAAMHSGALGYLRKPCDVLMLEAQVISAKGAFEARRATASHCAVLENSLQKSRMLLERLPRELAQQLCSAWDLRLVETGSHVRRVGAYSDALALALGRSAEDAATLGQVAMLHDLGKLAVPDAILTKPGQLSAEEFEIMKQHTVAGARMLSHTDHPFLDRARDVARWHHERWDGSGYPDQLRRDECPLDARIVGVADVYDALHQARCYKRAWPESEIMAYFREHSGKLFDAQVVGALEDNRSRLREIAAELREGTHDHADASGVVRKAHSIAVAAASARR